MTTHAPVLAPSVTVEFKVETPFRLAVRAYFKSGKAVFGLVLFSVLVFIALFAPLIAPQNPYDLAQLDIMNGRQPLDHAGWMECCSGSARMTRAEICCREFSTASVFLWALVSARP